MAVLRLVTSLPITCSLIWVGLAVGGCFDPESPDRNWLDDASSSSTGSDGEGGESSSSGDAADEADTDDVTTGEMIDESESSTSDDGDPSDTEERTCGDGIVEGDERCDDANSADGDGCSACVTDDGWMCDGQPSICSSLACDPLLQDCSEGDSCTPLEEAWVCVPDASGPEGQQGDACGNVDECDPGHICATPTVVPGCTDAIGCCTVLCDLGDPSCPDGLDCHAWYDVAPPGLESLGVCALLR